MRNTFILLCLALVCFATNTRAAVYRRSDKISDNFKQLDLAPEEIDPNVAPQVSNNDEGLDETTDEILNAGTDNEIFIEADEQTVVENEIVATVAPAVTTTVAPAETIAPATNTTPVKGEEEPTGLARYCKCTGNHCDCCRTFNVPFIPTKGPGCARMTYLGNEKMSVSLKYGDLTLASRTVSSRRARPICVGLPGGYSQFCGRIYGLSKANENFKACLGFELRADDEIEAALRVSCFKFGSNGLRLAEAEPLPVNIKKEEEDDDDDIFGFGAGGDDDDDDEDDYDEDDDEVEDDADDDAEGDAAPDADYGGFSLAGLFDELDDDDDEDIRPSSTPAVAPLSSLTPENSATRKAVDSVQSKDDNGIAPTSFAAIPATAAASTETEVPVSNAATGAVTSIANKASSVFKDMPDTSAKKKNSKKIEKNKKKKEASVDLTFELINSLLQLFN